MKKKIVAVYWLDVHSSSAWKTKEEALIFAKDTFNNNAVTYGEIVEKNKDYILLAATYSPLTEKVADITMLPRKMIRKIKILK